MDAPEDPLPPVIYTMENKPIVTCAGDQNLFTSIYPTLSQQLPREPMEWRRSYGRAPKMIHLESNFVQFKEELLPKEGNKALLTFPFLHIYWTECCDTEVYKATVKDDLTKWQNVLKAYSSVDWLIVVVENDAKKKNKTNILPRTSIVDKIRNDFCNKQSDRCVVLSDPLKDSSRTQESWNAFLTKLRTLLLMSFTKNLGKFEDDMRTLREKRTEPGWSFCEYFMVQEELAFVFEMLQQFEDALVQYDELDALFSQYVVNFGAGDGANWLTFFCQPVKSWNGLILRKPIDMEKRELIQRQEATLLDLRSYLFSRQCTLLLFLQRPWEVAQRALELLHSCVQELKLLEVSVPPGALDCWVFLSCLEVLQRIEGCCDRAQIDSNIAHTVGLWSYATEKLKSLGYLCGLVSEKGPNSEDLNRTVDLLAGLGAERPETANTAQSPYKKLKEALSSVEAFEKHYLDLSHATIEMFTSIGRIRSAKLVGKDLAEFYMRKKSPQKAEMYLQGALKNYLAEGWALPITHTRKQLAECQKRLGQIENYLQTSSLLASDQHLTADEREYFCREILSFASQQRDSPDSLLAGIPQKVKFTVTTGHYTVKNGDSLQLSNVDAMLILCPEENRAVIYSNTREKVCDALLRVQSSDKVTSISLPAAPTYHLIEFELEVLSLPSAPAAGGESTLLGVTEPHGKHKDTQKTGHCMATTDHKVSIDCPWSIYSTVIALTFSMPFRTTHSLLSSGTRKYVQVCVQNLSELDFQLSDSRLVDTHDSTDLRLIPLNTESEQCIHSRQAVFFVWELKWTQEPPPSLHCRFSTGFSPASEEQLSISLKPYTYEFQVENFFTLYNVRAEISPPPGTEHCRTGSLCSLDVSITRLSDLLEVDKDEALTESDEYFSTKLMYEVVDNSSNWAVCGKSSGVISMPVTAQATHRVHMEVMPLFAGYLPLPDVRLFKYLPHHSAQSSQLDADSWIENDSLSVDKHVDDQLDSGSVKSRGSVHSAASSEHKGLPMPRLRALPPGQAFNSSAGTQVLVIPSKDDHVLEVSVT
ncbi:trafficking protein particle complex subunit 10 isoform X2 [Bubalus kerabau]|uniref:trafficking protein particle complex subunit 10 isoform X2 n=1 Tax=Bubalus carabanensis TaxID=3119969 RepID=UPI00244EF165|nr:trafficking protein particle complex subunit 10 isoform X2 [Bubalus carabanensis]